MTQANKSSIGFTANKEGDFWDAVSPFSCLQKEYIPFCIGFLYNEWVYSSVKKSEPSVRSKI